MEDMVRGVRGGHDTANDVVDYHAVFASLVSPKLLLSRDLIILEANEAYLKSRQLPREAVVGRHITDVDPIQRLTTPGTVDRMLAVLKRSVRTCRYEIIEPYKADVLAPDGAVRERYILPTVMPVHSDTFVVTHIVLCLEDITQVHDAADDCPDIDDHVRSESSTLALRSSVERLSQSLARERRAALQLQDSVLTLPPCTPGLTVDVRYRPSSVDSSVGGDWYDVLARPDGRTIIIVGDVTGHDITAAVTMAQMRGVVRTVAFDEPGSPAVMMGRAETIARGLDIDEFAAVTIASIEPPDAEGRRSVSIVRAGSLSPVARGDDGRAHVVSTPVGAVFGLPIDGERQVSTRVMDPGESLLIFTDGLVERRDELVSTSIDNLVDAVTAMSATTPQQVCDAVLRVCSPNLDDDDVALVVVRIDPVSTDTLGS